MEIQRQDLGTDPHRARYHLGAIDVENLKAGQSFSELPDTYVIFITKNDFFGDGEAVYIYDRVNAKTGKPLNDGSHIIYVSADYLGDNDIAKLMHDFKCADPNKMYFNEMADSARYYKESSKGVNEVSAILDEMREEVRKKLRKKQ